MQFCVATLVFATALEWSAILGWTLIVLVAVYAFFLFRMPSRESAMARAAAVLGLDFSAKASRERMGTRGTTFDAGMPAKNCLRGMLAGRETVIFDQSMFSGGFARQYSGNASGNVETTVVGFRVPAESFCRDRGVLQASRWHVEKMGEWVFVFDENQSLVKPEKIGEFVEEARVHFQSATDPKGYTPTVLSGRMS